MTLSANQKERLRKLEAKLRAAVRAGEPERAAELAAEIQNLFVQIGATIAF